VIQDRVLLNTARTIAEASEGQAMIETIGRLDAKVGGMFFAMVDLGTLRIDPNGFDDKLTHYLGVLNNHTGKSSAMFVDSTVRWVCANTIQAGIETASGIERIRHMPNFEFRLDEAKARLSLSSEWEDEFEQIANRLVASPGGIGQLEKSAEIALGKKANMSNREKNNWDAQMATLVELYQGPNNSEAVGNNGWAVYNTIGEYIDHHKTMRGGVQMKASKSLNGANEAPKRAVAQFLLNA